MARKVQLRTLETKQKILTAAIKMFAKEGFARASFQDIADACDVSQAAVLHHFPNKESLFDAVIDRIARHNYQLVDEAFKMTDNAYVRLTKYFRTNLTWGYSYPEEGQILLLLFYFATVNLSFSGKYAGLQKTARLRLHEIVLAGEREKLFHPQNDAAQVGEMLHDCLVGLLVNFLTIVKIRGAKKFKSEVKLLERKWETQIALLTHYRK